MPKQESLSLNLCKICGTRARARKARKGYLIECSDGLHFVNRRTLIDTIKAWNKFFVKRRTNHLNKEDS